ncbi:hypothetical protein ACS0TY_006094 [Phlomoides rotata]
MAAPARNHRGLPCEARVGSAVSLHSNYVRGSFAFARSKEILQVLRPRFHCRGHLVHRYYQRLEEVFAFSLVLPGLVLVLEYLTISVEDSKTSSALPTWADEMPSPQTL